MQEVESMLGGLGKNFVRASLTGVFSTLSSAYMMGQGMRQKVILGNMETPAGVLIAGTAFASAYAAQFITEYVSPHLLRGNPMLLKAEQIGVAMAASGGTQVIMLRLAGMDKNRMLEAGIWGGLSYILADWSTNKLLGGTELSIFY